MQGTESAVTRDESNNDYVHNTMISRLFKKTRNLNQYLQGVEEVGGGGGVAVQMRLGLEAEVKPASRNKNLNLSEELSPLAKSDSEVEGIVVRLRARVGARYTSRLEKIRSMDSFNGC